MTSPFDYFRLESENKLLKDRLKQAWGEAEYLEASREVYQKDAQNILLALEEEQQLVAALRNLYDHVACELHKQTMKNEKLVEVLKNISKTGPPLDFNISLNDERLYWKKTTLKYREAAYQAIKDNKDEG